MIWREGHVCISRFIVIFFSFSHSFVRSWSLCGPARSYGAALGPYGISGYSLASDNAVEGWNCSLGSGTVGLHPCARNAELSQQEEPEFWLMDPRGSIRGEMTLNEWCL